MWATGIKLVEPSFVSSTDRLLLPPQSVSYTSSRGLTDQRASSFIPVAVVAVHMHRASPRPTTIVYLTALFYGHWNSKGDDS